MADSGQKYPEFTCFYNTFKFTSFSMSVGMIYPNPATDKWRLLAIPLILSSVIPLAILVVLDMLKLWESGRTLDVAKHVAMFLPFYVGFVKMCLMYYRRVPGKNIIDIMDKDYAYFNTLPDDFKSTVSAFIGNTHNYINIWIACVMMIFVAFVGSATISNIFSHLFMAEPKLYMIYDINMPGKEPEARFESPYFELMYVYTIYVSLIYILNFTGYDGLMMAAINHACLRQHFFVKRVEQALKLRGEALRERMSEAIKDQVEILKLIDLIQTTFNIYLGYMYVTVVAEMVICLYLTNEGYSFDFQFTCVSLGTILHIYVPCMLADKLKCTCAYTAVRLYCSGWENTNDVRVRRYIPFMIARAQSPVVLKAFGILTYEMDLFVRTSKTAYSLYTLLKTQQD